MAETCKKSKNVCRSDFEKNRKRRMLRHLRSNPTDAKTLHNLGVYYPGTHKPEPNHKGHRVLKFRHRWIQAEFDHKLAYTAKREAELQRAREALANEPQATAA
jgi:hypothetical protein